MGKSGERTVQQSQTKQPRSWSSTECVNCSFFDQCMGFVPELKDFCSILLWHYVRKGDAIPPDAIAVSLVSDLRKAPRNRRNLSDNFGVTAVAETLSRVQVLRVRLDDQHSVFNTAGSEKISSITLQYAV